MPASLSDVPRAAPIVALLLAACPAPEPPAAEPTPAPVALAFGDPIVRVDLAAPVLEVEDLERVGDTIWACSNSDGLVSLDVSDPADLRILTQWNLASPRCDHLAIDGDRLYSASHPLTDDGWGWMATVDVSDPSDPQVLDQVFAPRDPEGLTVYEGELLIATTDGLVAADPGPGWPERGLVPTSRAAQVRAAEGVAWIADGDEGLIAADVATLTRRGVLELPGNPADLELFGDRAVVALSGAGIALVDIADPDAPALLDHAETPGSALAVSVSEPWVWVADWLDLRLFRLEDDALVFVGRETQPFEIVPPPVDPNIPNFSVGVTAWDDLVVSSNWTEFASHRAVPGLGSGDLVVEPTLLRLPRAAPGETSRTSFVLRNDGTLPLTVDGLTVSGVVAVEQDLPLTLRPGEVEGVTLAFTPSGGGPVREELRVSSDDPDEPERLVSVLGNNQGLDVGDAVPDLTFLDLQGAPVRLDDRLGGPVLLAYFATF